MLKSSLIIVLFLLVGCHHKKGDLFLTAPATIDEPNKITEITESTRRKTVDVCTGTEEKTYCDSWIGQEEPLSEEVEIQADELMETKAVEARPETRDAQVQTEEEQIEWPNSNNSRIESEKINRTFNIDDVSEIESEYIVRPLSVDNNSEVESENIRRSFNIDDVSEVQSEYMNSDEQNESLVIEESILEGQEARKESKRSVVKENNSQNSVPSLSDSWEIVK
mgnify:CR=1 FL=1